MAQVLLVESADFSRQKNKYLLKGTGHSVVSRKSAEDAYKLIDSDKKFDLIIVDSKLDAEDGINVLQNIKAKFPRQKVILITGSRDATIPKRALSQGALAVYQKPLNSQKVETILEIAKI